MWWLATKMTLVWKLFYTSWCVGLHLPIMLAISGNILAGVRNFPCYFHFLAFDTDDRSIVICGCPCLCDNPPTMITHRIITLKEKVKLYGSLSPLKMNNLELSMSRLHFFWIPLNVITQKVLRIIGFGGNVLEVPWSLTLLKSSSLGLPIQDHCKRHTALKCWPRDCALL